MPKAKPSKEEKELLKQQEAEQKRLDQEAKLDNEMRSRTARYDQELVNNARELNINPDNFETEEELKLAINKVRGDLRNE